MTYNQFIKKLSEICNENGVGVSQDRLKKIIELMSNLIIEEIEEANTIKLREFLIIDLVEIPPKHLPCGKMSKEQYSIKIRLSDKYKKQVKEKLNKK